MRSATFARLFCAGLVAVSAWAQATGAPNEKDSSSVASTDPSPQAAPATQDAPAATPAPAAPPAKSIFTVGKVDFSGSADVYYSWNNNHPSGGFNQLYSFNDKTDQFNLNMAKLTASMDPAPIGFRVDIGLGRMYDITYPQAPDPGFFRYVEQAYVSVKPKDWKGFEADFGEFVTSAGAEVIESKDNWNYSRSLLFTLANPFVHFGLRTSMPVGGGVTVGVQVVNGWNNIIEPYGKNMQTVGITENLVRKKYSWANNYYVGQSPTPTNNGKRNLYDTVLLLTPIDKFSAYVNFDYAQQGRIGGGSDRWYGIAGAARWQFNKYFALSPRIELYRDKSGFTTGTPQTLHEFTLTGEYKIHEGLLSRLEYRRDASDVAYFQRGGALNASRSQSTVTIALIAYFAPKH